MRRLIVMAGLVCLALSAAFAAENKTITVAGFINTGDEKNADINVIITKSMVTFLSKIPGVKVTSYNDVEKSAIDMGYWKLKALDVETALGLGMRNNARQVITGEYAVDKSKDTISINISVFDVVTGELKLKRKFDGSAGIDLFDTIDKMIKNTTFLMLGKNIKMGKLAIDTAVDNRTYAIYINGVLQKELKKDAPFQDTIIAEEKVEVSLRVISGGSEKEVYRNFVTVKENDTYKITYQPGGSVIVKAVGVSGAKIFLDDQPVGETDANGDFTILNVSADKNHTIKVEKGGKTLDVKTMKISEGDSPALIIGQLERPFFFPVKFNSGGIGLSAGVDFYVLKDLRAYAMVGAVYLSQATNSPFAPTAEIGAAYCFLRLMDFSFWGNVSGFSYIYPFLLSPMVKLEAEWNHVFVEAGVRFSFDTPNTPVYPMIGIGYRL